MGDIMNDMTVCVPVNTDGTIHNRLGQAPIVATCHIHDGEVTDWTEHAVGWDQTYGVDVLGVHHPAVIRFMQDQHVNTVVADNVCDSMQTVLTKLGLTLQTGITGDARSAVGAFVPTA